jgi:SagB-type dehydrogenase family enzyme
MADALMPTSDELRDRLVGERGLFSISELYHENSKLTPTAPRVAQSAEAVLAAPSGFKRYVHAPRFALPALGRHSDMGLISTMSGRRSRRSYVKGTLGLDAVSTLLFCAAGTIDGQYTRVCPSAGGLYPLEFYLLAFHVHGLSSGLYHYEVRGHSLAQVSPGDHRPQFLKAVFIPEAVELAAAAIILSGVFGRSKIKYGERAYRFVLLEAGHAMQNFCLAGTALGLGTCPIGGFVDDALNDLLDVDGIDEAALYAGIIGIAG